MNRGRALGVNRKAQISYTRNNNNLREIKTEDLTEVAKSFVDLIEQILATETISNATFYDILKFIHFPKPKGEDKNHQMKLITISYVNIVLDEIDNMVKRYPNIRRKILFRREILDKFDILNLIYNSLKNVNIVII